MKVVSFLPSATEIVCALGLADQLCARSFECDYPPEVVGLPVVSGTALADIQETDPAEVDRAVSESVAAGRPIYTLDAALVRRIQPDLILAQDLCAVCAVPSGAVEDALLELGCRAEVLSLDPATLDQVIACIGAVGRATDTVRRAEFLMAALRQRLETVRSQVAGLHRPNVLALEWSDPPFNGGHWVPDMIVAAGGVPLLAPEGERSRRLTWDEIRQVTADVVVFMPCGYRLARAASEGSNLLRRPELASASQVWAVDADAYFSRPGPRVVDGVEILAWILHPDTGPYPATSGRDLHELAVRLR